MCINIISIAYLVKKKKKSFVNLRGGAALGQSKFKGSPVQSVTSLDNVPVQARLPPPPNG